MSEDDLLLLNKIATPRWEMTVALAVDAVGSPHTKRAYERAIRDFLAWYTSEVRPPLSRAILQQYRSHLLAGGRSAASCNVRLAAIRKLTSEAAENGLLDQTIAQGITSVPGVRQPGERTGQWLSRDQARLLLAQPDPGTAEGRRDRAILAVLLGCGLRRSEVSTLRWGDLVQREGRWVFLDLVGKGRRRRTVPVPGWVKVAIDPLTPSGWTTDDFLFRRIRKRLYKGNTPECLSERMIWHIVTKYARRAGIPDLAPHDLRRTCARLCRTAGGDIEQIQFLLGHSSIQTTERYLGSRQDLQQAVNDRLDLELPASAMRHQKEKSVR